MSGFKEYFTFNKAERRGIFVLAVILFALLLYDIFGPFRMDSVADQAEFKAEVDRFLATKEKEDKPAVKQKRIRKKQPEKQHKRKLTPRPFDPNTMSYEQWLDLGLSEKQARTIEKYKSKGGRFRRPEDFRKMYCITENEYEALEPFISINSFDEDDEPEVAVQPQIELNTVNEVEIQCVRGIGPAFAGRIIKYRRLLGGYVRVEQLMEVYGMDSSRYRQISPAFRINTDSVKQIPINTATYSQLRRHPYISNELAYEIVQFRKTHGNFQSVEQLKQINGVDDSLYQKIYLYFAVESK